MRRALEREWLDDLPAADPRAIHSRRDLRRLNGLMAHPRLIAKALVRSGFGNRGQRLIDLGGGDGHLLLQVARRLRIRDISGVVVDQRNLVEPATIRALGSMGWSTSTTVGDVFKVQLPENRGGTAIMANLFLHHFQDDALRLLLARVAENSDLFVACEPRRATLPLIASRCVGVVGCNSVTRHDAVVSVRAGFRSRELSHLWPKAADWQLQEHSAGLFSHQFVARRVRL